MTTLVTGSRGRVAGALTSLLIAAGEPVRAGSRTPDAVAPRPGVTAVPLGLAEPAGFPAALDGVDSVFLYAEPAHLTRFLADAEAAGVGHVVLLSSSAVLGPAAAHSPIAHRHSEAETALAASPLASTVLRPGAFATNALQWVRSITTTGSVRLPYPDAQDNPVHEADLAEAAFTVLTRPEHRGGAYHVTGPQSLSFREQIVALGAANGQDIAVVEVDAEEWKANTAKHMPPGFADAMIDGWKARAGAPVDVTDTLESLIGRAPRPFAAWAADHAAEFKR